MTISLSLPPETERQLHERVLANGKSVEAFITDLVEREVEAGSTSHAVSLPKHSSSLDEILEPVRREFDESGMSEEEFVRFVTGLRDDVRREKAAQTTT